MSGFAARAVEWLFGSSPAAFRRGELALGAPVWVWLLAAAALFVVVYFVLGYRVSGGGAVPAAGGRSRRVGRLLLPALRASVLALLVLCMLGPQLVLSSVIPQENVVAVLLDDSASMRIGDGDGGASRGEAAKNAFLAGAADSPGARLREKFVLRMFRFSDGVERIRDVSELGFAAPRTDIAASLAEASAELSAMPLAGVVLVTDGAANRGQDRLDESLMELRERGTPVHAIMVGEEEPSPDLEIGAPDVPGRVLKGSVVEVRVPVRARGDVGGSARIEALDNGRLAASANVTLDRSEAGAMATLRFPAEEAGPRRLRIRAAAAPGELITRNNERTVLAHVEDRALKLLYFEGQPRWEFKYLRRAVSGDEAVQVAFLVRTAEGKFYRPEVESAEELAGGFPSTREALFEYAAVILGSVEASFFTHDQLLMLRDLVSERGGGLLALGGGSAYAEGGYAGTPVADLLPLTIDQGGDDGGLFRSLRVRPTRAGASHPVVRLDPDPTASADRYRTLPALSSVNRTGTAKPGATTLLVGEDDAGEEHPVLLFQRFGRGRAASLTVQDLWTWQMAAEIPLEDETHERLWRRLLRWLATEAPRRVEPWASPVRAVPGERVEIGARVADARYLAVNGARVRAEITAPDGGVATLPLPWTGSEDGVYRASFEPVVAGIHSVTVRADVDGESVPDTGLYFEAGNVDDEFFNAGADRGLLERIAEATGGAVFRPGGARSLVEDLSVARGGASVIERRDLWNVPAVFLLLLLLVCAEWAVRNRWGLA